MLKTICLIFMVAALNGCAAAPGNQPHFTKVGTQQAAFEIGDRMSDGTIYAGISPGTGNPLYVTSQDAPRGMDFDAAERYANKLDVHGHRDWRVPTKAELNLLFQNRNKGNLKGTFNVTGAPPAGYYWSSTSHPDSTALAQRFSNGAQDYFIGYSQLSVRCVRDLR